MRQNAQDNSMTSSPVAVAMEGPAEVAKAGPSRLVIVAMDILLASAAGVLGLLLGWPEFGSQGNLTVWYGAIAIGALVVVSPWRWWTYSVALVAATYFASIHGGWTPLGSWVRAASDLVVVVLAALALRRLRCIPFLAIRDAIAFVAVLDVAGGIRSLVGPGLAAVSSFARGSQTLPAVCVGLSTVIGGAVVVPLIVLVVDRTSWPLFSRRNIKTGVAATLAVAALVGATFFEPPGLLYLGLGFLIIPAFVVLAVRFSQLNVAVTLFIAVSGMAAGTTHDLGPFAVVHASTETMLHVILTVQLFLVALPVGTWILVAAMAANRKAVEVLQDEIDVDAVTGLRSREWMIDHLRHLLEGSSPGIAVAALFIDVSQFALVRHSLGYRAGDEVMTQIADDVAELVPGGGELGRFDGERLLMVVPGLRGVVELSELADRVAAVIAAEREVRGKRMARSGTIGVAVGSAGTTAEGLLRDADLALVAALSEGGRGWKVFEYLDGDEGGLLTLEHAMRVGLERNEFVAYFQPQVQMYDGAICGYEALVRWIHPDRGLVPPVEFIPAAERTGLIIPLGQAVLDQACALLVARPDIPAVSVNVSAVQLAHDAWLASVKAALRSTGVEPSRLILELTETAIFRLTDLARGALVELHELGVGIHVDDFGTGFSSLSNLRDLPVTGLKLDRSFVTALSSGDEGALALVRGLAGLANGLGLETVAEGVETEDQAQILVEAGWTLAQGYLYGRPEAQVKRGPGARPTDDGRPESTSMSAPGSGHRGLVAN